MDVFYADGAHWASWTVGMVLLWVIGTALIAALVIIGVDLSRRRHE
jgi:hypothetical protein